MSFLVLALPVRRQVSSGRSKPVKFAAHPHLARYTCSSVSCATNMAHVRWHTTPSAAFSKINLICMRDAEVSASRHSAEQVSLRSASTGNEHSRCC